MTIVAEGIRLPSSRNDFSEQEGWQTVRLDLEQGMDLPALQKPAESALTISTKQTATQGR